MIKYKAFIAGIFILGVMPLMAQEDDAKSKKDRFFSIGFNYTTIGGDINRGSSGMGNSIGLQINARVISLFKGDLSTSFGGAVPY